jgi:hypothetical protein
MGGASGSTVTPRVTSFSYDGDGNQTSTTTGTASASTTSPTSSADHFTYATTTPTISAVGSLVKNSGTAKTTLAVSPSAVGNTFVLSTMVVSTTVTVSSVSGGGVTTSKLTSAVDSASGAEEELWLGPITATGSSTITVTYSGSISGKNSELDAQEYSSSAGASTTWAKDVVGSHTNSSSTTVTFPSLTPTGSGELYIGFANVANNGV